MRREDILEILGEDWTKLQETIAESLHSDISLLDIVNAGILAHNGKMLRPMVTLLIARCIKQGVITPAETFNYAAASELLHNATLLHDDVADESDTRRGRPTLRATLGPSQAVLVGDFWLSRAVLQIINANPAKSHLIIPLFSNTLSHLAEGEMLQLEKASDISTTQEDYFRIIFCKTASLFVSAAKSGAIASDADEKQLAAASTYGEALGTAFQIRDDILDYVGDEALGKPVGIDIREKKITLPLFLSMQNAEDEEYVRNSLRKIDSYEGISEEIRKFVGIRAGVPAAEKVLSEYVDKALHALEALPACKERDCLAAIAKLNLGRIQ